MNNFRFEKFVRWTELNFLEEQESVPLLQGNIPQSLFGQDFEQYMTWSEMEMVLECHPSLCNYSRFGMVKCPESQLSSGTAPLLGFYFYIALPETRLLNFAATGKLSMSDFPFLGSEDEGLKMNLSLNARSALLFATFAQSKSHMDFPNDELKFDAQANVKLLCFKLSASKFMDHVSDGTFSFWNRKYLDYFVSTNTIQLDKIELETLHVFNFGFEEKWTFGRIVASMNNELDEWIAPSGQKVHHWRHFHLPLSSFGIMSQLVDMEYFEEHANDETLQGLTRTFSTMSFESFEVVNEEDLTLEEGTLSLSVNEGEELSPKLSITADLDMVVYVTQFGAKHHYFTDCTGLNNAATFTVTLSQAANKPLCLICKKRSEEAAQSSN